MVSHPKTGKSRMSEPRFPGLARHGLAVALAAALAACGTQSDANAVAGNMNGGNLATPAAARPASLPPAALAAWEGFASSACALDDARFNRVAFAPLSGTGDAIEQVEAQFAADRGGFITADFNGDDRPDYLVVTPGHGCANEGPPYGNAGPPNDFILSGASGYRVSDGFMGWAAPAMIERRGEHDVLVYAGGGFNGRCGAVMSAVWGWTGQAMEVIERRNDRGEIVDEQGCRAGAGQAASGAGLPVREGLWADSRAGGCNALQANDPAFIIAENRMLWVQDFADLDPVRNLGNGRYQTGRDMETKIIHVASPTRLTIERGGEGSYIWCSPETSWEPWASDLGEE